MEVVAAGSEWCRTLISEFSRFVQKRPRARAVAGNPRYIEFFETSIAGFAISGNSLKAAMTRTQVGMAESVD